MSVGKNMVRMRFSAGLLSELKKKHWRGWTVLINERNEIRPLQAEPEGASMLELRNIQYDVEENREILKDINLKIEERFVAVTGPNGGGKSTLAKIIAGIVKPTAGRILLDGEDITESSITERAKKGISYAFQQPVRFKGLTVKDLLTMAAGKNTSVQEACGILSEVGLCARDYVNREVNASLSGGELKRIEIAMIIARGTRFSIFDEPEAGIDLWSFARLTETFEQLHAAGGATMVIISHQERIISLADEVIVVGEGRLLHRGTPEEILPQILADTLGACPVLRKEAEAR